MTVAQRILLVDDDPAIRASLTFALELEGFEVETFPTGESITGRPPQTGDVCLILDYRLPGLDGLSTLARLRARDIALPALLITSNPTRNIRERAAEAGVPVIEKPLLCNALINGIRSLISAA